MGFECFDGIFIEGGRENYGGRLFDQFQHFKPIDLWHLDIQENQIGFVLCYGLYTLKPVVTGLYNLELWISLADIL